MKHLRIHYFQHVPFEGLGNIEEWATANGHKLTSTQFYEDSTLPALQDFDWLIIMGGTMGVYDEEKYSWLVTEKRFIRQAIEAGKTILGICLGAQLLAEVLGSKVYSNKDKEIGWFPIQLSLEATKNKLFAAINSPVIVFHWHGDTFDLPQNAIHLAHSEACKNQAFVYNKKVLGFQFHLEMSETILRKMIDNDGKELIKGTNIQDEKEILSQQKFIENNKQLLFTILDRLDNQE